VTKKYPIIARPQYLSKTRITIYGEWFNYITGFGVYLSAMKSELNTDLIDLYSEDPKLVVNNPGFYGIPITEYNIVSNNILEFFLPETLISSDYDIIICNPAGYTKASTQIALNVLKVVGVFTYKNLKSISGDYTINSIENINFFTIRPQFVADFLPAMNVTLNGIDSIISITGNNIYTIERFLTSN